MTLPPVRALVLWLLICMAGLPGLTLATDATDEPLSAVWKWGGLAVGTTDPPPPGGPPPTPQSLLMAEVIARPQGGFRMFYNLSRGAGREWIAYADSDDGESWTVRGEVLESDTQPTDPRYVMGGARVVRLRDGRYRMYLRASPEHRAGEPPRYKIYSALSADGEHFSMEPGVRIDISPDDPSSPLVLAGHGAFYGLPDGRFAGIISANPVGDRGPSDLFICQSADGLSWAGCTRLYDDFHDPVVVKRGGTYYLIAKLLDQATYYGMSSDGINWPSRDGLMRLSFFDAESRDVSGHVGDVGAFVAPDGEIWMLSNWGRVQDRGSVSTAIARFVPEN
jgi:hypothetical protein